MDSSLKIMEKVQNVEELLNKIINSLPNIVSIYEIETDKILFTNGSVLKSLGYPTEDVLKIRAINAEKRQSMYHPEDVDIVRGLDSRIKVLKDEEVVEAEYRILAFNGNYEWFKHSVTIFLRDSKGVPVQTVNVFENITAKKMTELDNKKLSSAVEQSPVSIILTDPEGRIEYVNPRFEEITGYSAKEVKQKSPTFLNAFDPEGEMEKIKEVITKGDTFTGEVCSRKKNGELFWERKTISPIFDEKKRISSYAWIKEDITEQKNSELLLAKKSEEISLLLETGRYLAGTLNIDELYDRMWEVLSKVLDCSEFFVSSYDEKDRLIKYVYMRTEVDDKKLNVENIPPIPLAPEGYGIISQVIWTRKPLIINNYQEILKKSKTRYTIDASGKIVGDMETDHIQKSAIAIPILLDNKILGVIHIYSLKENAYSEAQLNFVQALMNQVALANNNALLYRNLQKELREKVLAEESLKRSEERLRQFAESIPDAVYRLNFETGYEFLSPSIEQIVGYTVDEISQDPHDFVLKLLHPEDKEWATVVYKGFLESEPTEELSEVECRIIRKDGKVIWIRDTIRLEWKGRKVFAANGIISDITEKKIQEEIAKVRKEKTILRQSALLQLSRLDETEFGNFYKFVTEITLKALDADRTSIWFFEDDGSITAGDIYERAHNSHTTTKKLDGTGIKHFAEKFSDQNEVLVYADPKNRILSEFTKAFVEQFGTKGLIISKISFNNKIVGFLCTESLNSERTGWISEDNDFSISVCNFISRMIEANERKKAELEIKKSLKDKEILLREIHHRVKNNLQVISSLLYLQARKLKDPNILAALEESHNRIRSMALVHEKLYKSKDIAGVDYSDYIKSLVSSIFKSYSNKIGKLSLELDAKDLRLNLDMAVCCGLIVNELVSNAIKHGFPDDMKGRIAIKFYSEDSTYVLKIADDGIGFPKGLDFRECDSLGLQLVTMLVDQLHGSIDMTSGKGTEFTIKFR